MSVLTSPSVQMRALPDGTVELLSTHDQLLGGASGQAYLGCVFPADPAYARSIAEPAMVVGRHLAGLGVIGRFAVDFVTVRGRRRRLVGVRHRAQPAQGRHHAPLPHAAVPDRRPVRRRSAASSSPRTDRSKHLVATDHLEDERLRPSPSTTSSTSSRTRRLHFDAARQTGTVLHMISCVTECGRLGLTAVGDSAEQAWKTLRGGAGRVLLEEAGRALQERPIDVT